MVDGQVLENIYKESLEENLISCIAREQNISLEDALDLYYRSKLSDKIHNGEFGIQYLDYRYLYELLLRTEPELFGQRTSREQEEN